MSYGCESGGDWAGEPITLRTLPGAPTQDRIHAAGLRRQGTDGGTLTA